MSSELKLTNIKHPSSGSNNLVLGSDGNVSIPNTLSAGTIGSSVTGQNRPYFYCSHYSTNQTMSGSGGGDDELTVWVEGTNGDPDSKMNTSTGRFTPSIAGIYLFGARVYIEGAPSSFSRVMININNGSDDKKYSEIMGDSRTIDITRMAYVSDTGYASVIVDVHTNAHAIRGDQCHFWGMRIA